MILAWKMGGINHKSSVQPDYTESWKKKDIKSYKKIADMMNDFNEKAKIVDIESYKKSLKFNN